MCSNYACVDDKMNWRSSFSTRVGWSKEGGAITRAYEWQDADDESFSAKAMLQLLMYRMSEQGRSNDAQIMHTALPYTTYFTDILYRHPRSLACVLARLLQHVFC